MSGALARLDPARLRHGARRCRGKPEQAVALVVGGVECYLPLAGMVDLDAERAAPGARRSPSAGPRPPAPRGRLDNAGLRGQSARRGGGEGSRAPGRAERPADAAGGAVEGDAAERSECARRFVARASVPLPGDSRRQGDFERPLTRAPAYSCPSPRISSSRRASSHMLTLLNRQ